jgi:hypothetical protein
MRRWRRPCLLKALSDKRTDAVFHRERFKKCDEGQTFVGVGDEQGTAPDTRPCAACQGQGGSTNARP